MSVWLIEESALDYRTFPYSLFFFFFLACYFSLDRVGQEFEEVTPAYYFSFTTFWLTLLFLDLFAHSHALLLPLYIWLPPNILCVYVQFCWCTECLGQEEGFLMRMYRPCCRQPSSSPAAEMDLISLTGLLCLLSFAFPLQFFFFIPLFPLQALFFHLGLSHLFDPLLHTHAYTHLVVSPLIDTTQSLASNLTCHNYMHNPKLSRE